MVTTTTPTAAEVMADPTTVALTTTTGEIAGTTPIIRVTPRVRIRDVAKSVVFMATVLVPVLSSNFMEVMETRTSHLCPPMLLGSLGLILRLQRHTMLTTGSYTAEQHTISPQTSTPWLFINPTTVEKRS